MTLTYIYSDSTAVLGPLATFAEPHAYDLCPLHSEKLTVPNGWSVVKSEIQTDSVGPNEDDLMAIADAVREVGTNQVQANLVETKPSEIGRRGHLRALPSN
jgi:hypothetical protein